MVETLYILSGICLALSGMIAVKLLMMIPIVRILIDKIFRR